jgi:hypothetical protein
MVGNFSRLRCHVQRLNNSRDSVPIRSYIESTTVALRLPASQGGCARKSSKLAKNNGAISRSALMRIAAVLGYSYDQCAVARGLDSAEHCNVATLETSTHHARTIEKLQEINRWHKKFIRRKDERITFLPSICLFSSMRYHSILRAFRS